MTKIAKAIYCSRRYLVISFLAFIFFATSLGIGLGLNNNGGNARTSLRPSSTDAAAWPDSPPWPLEFVQVAAGNSHSLAITTTGDLYSWGYNNNGQLGLGNTTTESFPQQIMSGTKFASIAAGYDYSLAITTTGSLYSFGSNNLGQLGLGNTTNQSSPQLVKSGTTFASVSAGYNHSLAITTTGALYSFGSNYWGQLGNGTTSNYSTSTPQLIMSGTTFNSIAAGGSTYNSHSLATTTTGALYSFGLNNYGQLGLGNNTSNNIPQLVMEGTIFSSIAAGGYHSLAITNTGKLYSWGNNENSQLGLGNNIGQSTPQLITGDTSFACISAGDFHSLAIATTGSLYSFGFNSSGQLGLSNTTTQSVPQLIMENTLFSSIAAGNLHSLAITAGALYSFGQNSSGQLGLGDITNSYSSPQLVAMRPSSNIRLSFSSFSSASSRTSVDGQAFVPESSFEVDNGGELSIIFQTTTQITQFDVNVSGETATFTQFNAGRDIGDVSFELMSTDAVQVTMTITNITSDISIVCKTLNTWQVECIDEYSGSNFVNVSTSYAALANPTTIPEGKTFAGWFNYKGEQVTAAYSFSDITNWDSVERITRVYAKWI